MKLAAVLLVGGESTRMGRDKATMSFEDQPLWQRQVHLLRTVVPAEILISARADPVWRPADTKFVADKIPARGPLSGLVAAITHMNGTHLLALAVDMPFLTKPNLEWLVRLAKPGCGVLPCIGDRAEPLAAIYPRESAPGLSAALESGELSLQRVTKKLIDAGLLSVARVSATEGDCYRSLNHPADLARAIHVLPAYPT